MRLLVAGDTHGNLDHLVRELIPAAHDYMVDAIVQVGDFGYTWPRDYPENFEALHEELDRANLPMYWLDGNHDNYTDLKQRGIFTTSAPATMTSRITYLPRGVSWDWDDVVFMSLGGAVSIDKAYRTKGLSWWPEESLSYDQINRAAEVGKVDVMFTHDCPAGVRSLEKYLQQESERMRVGYKIDAESTAHREALRAVCNETQPELLIHGHYHHRYLDAAPWAEDATVVGLDRDDQGPRSWLILDTANYRGTGKQLLAA
jgi:UDP-2,3-diacylglucosamine pyrophosphatase LpxH